jgi:NAD(P)-dependent dehydrogenase (short-subunit alcohol dehydrogenase family)
MQIRLDNQVALVNCASSGIGRACALAQQIVDQGGQAIAVRADVTDANGVDRLMRTTVDAVGGIDVAVTTASTYQMASLEDTTDDIRQRYLAVNCCSGVSAPERRSCRRHGYSVSVVRESLTADPLRKWHYQRDGASMGRL